MASRRQLLTQEAFAQNVETYGDPMAEIAKIAFREDLAPDLRLNALKEFASFGHTKLKAIEISGAIDVEHGIKQTLIDAIMASVD